MFRRRRKLTWLQRTREFLWPSSGFGRSSRYLMHRVGRLPGTPTSIALGFACGAAVAVTPFVGFHLVIALVVAWIVRASPVAAAIGTLVANPWTVPLILFSIYRIGTWMLRQAAHHHLPRDVGLFYLFHHPLEVLLPMTLGSIPLAATVWVICFFAARPLVAGYHRRRQERTDHRRRARRHEEKRE